MTTTTRAPSRRRFLALAAAIPLLGRLRLAAAPQAKPRFQWLTGPILTVPELTQRFQMTGQDPLKWGFVQELPWRRICYGQLLDTRVTGGNVRVLNWAKMAPVPEDEAQAFLTRHAAMWPRASIHSDEHKCFVSCPEQYLTGDFEKGIIVNGCPRHLAE